MAIPSVIRWYCVKTAKPIVDTLPSPGSRIILVLCHLSVKKFIRGHPKREPQIHEGVKMCDFRPIHVSHCISETVRDRGTVTVVDYSRIICTLSNRVVYGRPWQSFQLCACRRPRCHTLFRVLIGLLERLASSCYDVMITWNSNNCWRSRIVICDTAVLS